jgi:triphosphatase
MEIELKYAISSDEIAKQLWEDETLKQYEEPFTRETVFMKAIYFDTEDYTLSQNDMAYRVRWGDDNIITSLKWGGTINGALHIREEINVPVTNTKPNPVIFEESEEGKKLLSLLQGRPLQSIMEMRFRRRRFRIDTERSIMEISIDRGNIFTENRECPICEVEIELFSGDREELMDMGQTLADTYGLVSEKRSKFARGLVLARGSVNPQTQR